MTTTSERIKAKKLVQQLNDAIAELNTFPGLGPERSAGDFISSLLTNLRSPNGGLRDEYAKAQIIWYFTPEQLREAAENRLRKVGSAAPDIAMNARCAVRKKIKSVRVSRPAFLGRPPTDCRFRYILPRVVGRMRIDNRSPYPKQRYWDIGGDWAEVRRLEAQINQMLESLHLDCLTSGRALAFMIRASGAQFVTQKLWVSEGAKLFDGELNFVLVSELPNELSAARLGAVPTEEIDREQCAKRSLERVYKQERFADRKLTKETMVSVISEMFQISKSAARTRVWPNAEICEWKKQSRPKFGSKIAAQELRTALNEIKNP